MELLKFMKLFSVASKFNLLLCLLLLLQLVDSKPFKDEVLSTVKTAVAACRLETGATEADLEDLMQKLPAKNMAAKCLRACLMKKFHLMDSNGKFNEQVALQIISQLSTRNADKFKKATDIASICYNMEVSANHCEAAEQYKKCTSTVVTA